MITAIAPHTRIDNSIILNMAEIGVYTYAVYSAIKMHLNRTTGACFPSYATIARITGINRSTVIACVKKLAALKLISPLWRYKEDGSHASNQYDFQGAGSSAPSEKIDKSAQIQDTEVSVPSEMIEKEGQRDQGSRPEPPPLVAPDNPPGRPEPPEQVFSLNKKERTITEVDLMPTARQKTCPHPLSEIVFLPEGITICHHCYGLLDENFKLKEEKPPSVEREAA